MNNLEGWDLEEQQKRVIFMDHCYKVYGRDNKDHPMHGVYTGLWEEFCIKEAGYAMRDRFFEMMDAIAQYEAGNLPQA
jgi:actin-related protein|tara:strand:- start:5869 stop:6102 length:234 start_codon:yes stop_codon:yes gene_type:complete